MTSLAVRLETSSTSQKGKEDRRGRERRLKKKTRTRNKKNIRQAAKASADSKKRKQQSKKTLKSVRAMQRGHASVCAQNHFQIINLSHPAAEILTDIHGSLEDLELQEFFLKRI